MPKRPSSRLWLYKINILKEFIEENSRLPTKYEKYKNENIGNWLFNRQLDYRKGKLDPDRAKMLKDMEALPEKKIDENAVSPEEKINILREFINIYGYPPPFNTIYKGQKIGVLYNNLKLGYNNNALSEKKIDQIADIIPLFSNTKNNVIWQQRYEELKSYIEDKGTIHYDDDFSEYSDVNLYTWLNNQRNLDEEREKMIKALGLKFMSRKKASWDDYYSALQDYIEDYGTLPSLNVEYQNLNLGQWLNRQIQMLRKGLLNAERTEKLKSNPFYEKMAISQWEKLYGLCLEYLEECKQPIDANTIYKGFEIGAWYKNQCYNYRKKLLAEEKNKLIMKLIEKNSI